MHTTIDNVYHLKDYTPNFSHIDLYTLLQMMMTFEYIDKKNLWDYRAGVAMYKEILKKCVTQELKTVANSRIMYYNNILAKERNRE